MIWKSFMIFQFIVINLSVIKLNPIRRIMLKNWDFMIFSEILQIFLGVIHLLQRKKMTFHQPVGSWYECSQNLKHSQFLQLLNNESYAFLQINLHTQNWLK